MNLINIPSHFAVKTSYSTLKGQTREVLGKCRRLCCGQPLSVDLDHRVSGGQEKRRPIRVEPAASTLT